MTDSTPLSPAIGDETLSVLAHDDCRAVLHYFRRHSTDVTTVSDLTEFICERQETEDRSGIEISLHHSALPRLADAGIVDYDAESNTARYRANSPVEEWLDHLAEHGELPV